MIKKTIKIQMHSGMDVRPVALLVQIANQYNSEIHLQDDKHRFNAKSIMGMMTLCTTDCSEIEVTAEGSDEEAALNHIERFLEGNVN